MAGKPFLSDENFSHTGIKCCGCWPDRTQQCTDITKPVMALTVTWAATLTLPSRSSVLAVMNSVANFAQHRYPPTAEAYWDDGVYHLGVIALYNVSHDTDVLADTETFGVYNTWGARHGAEAAIDIAA